MAIRRSILSCSVALVLVAGLAPAQPASAASTADLSVALVAGPNPVIAGNLITYKAVLTNLGPGTAANAQMLMLVAPGNSFVSATSSAGTCLKPPVHANAGVLCSFGALSAAAGHNKVQVNVVEQIVAFQGKTEAAVKVHTSSSDPNLVNNDATRLVPITPRVADLSVHMVAPTQVTVGGLLTYTLTAHNAGPESTALDYVNDRLPKGTAFLSATTSQGKCLTPAVGGSGMVRCPIGPLGILATNDSATITIKAQEFAPGGTLNNIATINSAHAQDPTPSDNVASADTSLTNGIVLPPPATTNLTVALSADKGFVAPGGTLTYLVTVANNGPDAASEVGVQDAVPAGATFVSATPSQGTCTSPAVGQTGTVQCDFGALANQGASTVSMVVKVTAGLGAMLSDTATALPDLDDFVPSPADMTSTLSTAVNEPVNIIPGNILSSDVGIRLTTTNTPSHPDYVLQTVTLTNHGPDNAADVQFSVDFANGVAPVVDDISHLQGSCTSTKSNLDTIVNCDAGPVKFNGGPVQFTIPTHVTEATVLKDPKNLTTLQVFGTNPDLFTGQNAYLNQAGNAIKTLAAEAFATITSESGMIFDSDTTDKLSAMLVGYPPPAIVVPFQHPKTCKNKDFGMFGALLQIDCKSPINKAFNAASELASLAASAVGNSTMGTVVFFTIDVIVELAEDTEIVR